MYPTRRSQDFFVEQYRVLLEAGYSHQEAAEIVDSLWEDAVIEAEQDRLATQLKQTSPAPAE